MRGPLCLLLYCVFYASAVRAAPAAGGSAPASPASSHLAPSAAPASAVPASAVPASAVPASAAPKPAAPSAVLATQAPAKQWYGWQLLLSDATSVVAALLSQSGEVLIASYLVLPPVLHLANRQPGRAAGSFGLRVALPVVFAQAMASQSDGDAIGSFDLGLEVGAGLASLIDGVVLGWKPPAPPEAPDKAPKKEPWVGPYIQPLPRGVGAGLRGAF